MRRYMNNETTVTGIPRVTQFKNNLVLVLVLKALLGFLHYIKQ